MSDVCCVTDTNVWIDLQAGGLLDNVFELEVRWLIPDLVYRELKEPLASLLVGWGLDQRSLDGDEVEAVVALGATYPRPSRTDLATLVVARAEGGILVTGDGALRSAAEAEGLEVHGTLWVADLLVDTGTSAPREVARALELLREDPTRWLPKHELDARIKRWGSGQR
jgi:hypothetical protein